LILSFTPFNLVDFLLDFQGLEIIEFWFMRLKFGVEFVLAALFLCRYRTCGKERNRRN